MIEFSLKNGGGPIKIANELEMANLNLTRAGASVEFQSDQPPHPDQEASGRLIEPKNCEHCDAEFIPYSGRQKFCKDPECTKERQKLRVKINRENQNGAEPS